MSTTNLSPGIGNIDGESEMINGKKQITIVTPCLNEAENIGIVYREMKDVRDKFPEFLFEHLFIDNCSTDGSTAVLRKLAASDPSVKVIINAKNFGQIRSPYHGLLQAGGDAVILTMANLKEPPELVEQFIQKWKEGFSVVVGIKNKSAEHPFMFLVRRIFYFLVEKMSETENIKNFIGCGLFDRSFIEILRKLDDPFPYLRGMIAEYSYDRANIPYVQRRRLHGKSKNNFYTLYDYAMLGFVYHSKVPIRIASLAGFSLSLLSLLAAFAYLVLKLIFWDEMGSGYAPIMISLFFLGAVQLFFIGIIGEYIGAIYTHVKHKPLVVERERINFN